MDRIVHVVCLDAPAPPDYGAAIDMFYKLQALAESGISVHLHYFSYNGRHHAGLERFCDAIYSYPRTTGIRGLKPFLPYIVSSRINQTLIRRLNEDNHPVLLEGLHTTGIIQYLKNKNRNIVIRIHNDEALYYHNLKQSERRWFQKFYFAAESWLLHRYQLRLPKQMPLAALAATDQERFAAYYGFAHVSFIPGFVPWQTPSCREGTGDYCLYHGNLQVPENEQAALSLIEQVFRKSNRRLVIAGWNISESLQRKAAAWPHIQCIPSPDDDRLQQLIAEAHINILPSLNNTGVKFKLLHALFAGRFCITNRACVAGSLLQDEVVLAETAEEYLTQIEQLFGVPFSAAHLEKRRASLLPYRNEVNAGRLTEILYSRYP